MRQAQIQPRSIRKAFTFAEIMFAVVILGIGFIMLAGIFPVAIQDTRTTQSESYANPMIQNAIQTLTRMAKENAQNDVISASLNDATFPVDKYDVLFSPSDVVLPGTLPSWGPLLSSGKVIEKGFSGELISRGDNRYAWSPIYRYRKGDNLLEVTLFACEAYDTGTGFTKIDPNNTSIRIPDPSMLLPVQVTVTCNPDNTVSIAGVGAALSPGNFVVISAPNFPTKILRLANQEKTGFSLYPNYSWPTDTIIINGKAIAFPSSAAGFAVAKVNAVNDIAVVTTCIPVKPWTAPY